MIVPTPRLRGLLLYACATIPFGIVLHLAAEATALGSASGTAEFALRHVYLLALGCLSFGLSLVLGRAYQRPGSLLTAALMRDLPYGGSGARFFALGWILQAVFFGVTLAGEQAPLHAADWLAGGVVALLTATLGSGALMLLPRGVACIIAAVHARREERSHRAQRPAPAFRRNTIFISGYGAVLGNRPPPHFLGACGH